MEYPSYGDYQTALQMPDCVFSNILLKTASIETNPVTGQPRPRSGGFVLTYKATCKDNRVRAIRCFHKYKPDIEERYHKIGKYLAALQSHYFVKVGFIQNGITLLDGKFSTQHFPIVTMDWCDWETMGAWLARNHNDREAILRLRDVFVAYASYSESERFAHGDIQLLNVVVSTDGSSIKLIDYDGMFVPELEPLGASECGNVSFQHPLRDKHFNERLDRFSLLVLYTGLTALAYRPDLWQEYRSGEGLIFSASDFSDPDRSRAFGLVNALPECARLSRCLAETCKGAFEDIPSLQAFISPTYKHRVYVGTELKQRSTVETGQKICLNANMHHKDFSIYEKHLGDIVTLVGRITSARLHTSGRRYLFVNFCYIDSAAGVTALIVGEALNQLGETEIQRLLSSRGEWVALRGLLEKTKVKTKINRVPFSYQINFQDSFPVLM